MDPFQTTKHSFKYDLMVFILTNKALSVTYFTKINVFLQTWGGGKGLQNWAMKAEGSSSQSHVQHVPWAAQVPGGCLKSAWDSREELTLLL